jgi:hypothetical protein
VGSLVKGLLPLTRLGGGLLDDDEFCQSRHNEGARLLELLVADRGRVAFRLGSSNMVSSRMLSMIECRPRAPVLRSIASRAMALSASSAKLSAMLSISNSRWYCLALASNRFKDFWRD